jgi:hypothetical protein
MMYLIAFLLFIIALPMLVPLAIIVFPWVMFACGVVIIAIPPVYTVLAYTGGAHDVGAIFFAITLFELLFVLCKLSWVDWSRFNR